MLQPGNKLPDGTAAIVVKLLSPKTCPDSMLTQLRGDVSRYGHFSGPYTVGLLQYPGFWCGGSVKATSHSGWARMLATAPEAMCQVRRMCLRYYDAHGKAPAVAESTQFTRRASSAAHGPAVGGLTFLGFSVWRASMFATTS